MARRRRDARPRLLLVEDDPGIRESVLMTVAEHYRTTVSTCLNEAHVSLVAERFDLALIDLRLPFERDGLATNEQGGVELLRTIRSRGIMQTENRRALPVVVMTAFAPSPSQTAALFADHGASDFVAKPFGKDELLDKLRRALLGQGAVVPAAERGREEIRLAFDMKARRVQVEGLAPLDGGVFDLLDALRAPFLADLSARRPADAYTYVTTQALMKRFGVGEDALRRRVLRARKLLRTAIERDLHRTTSEQDVIESAHWRGYRLNPLFVRLVDPPVVDVAAPR